MVLVFGCSGDDETGEIPDNREPEEIVMDNTSKVQESIHTIFEDADSVGDMSKHLSEVRALPNVVDAWQNEASVSVKIKDGGIIMYCFPPVNKTGNSDVSKTRKAMSLNKDVKRARDIALCENKNACIVNTIPYDEDRKEDNGVLLDISNALGENRFDVRFFSGEEVTVDFLCKQMPNYGVIVLFTHGEYDNGQHWIMTGTTYDDKQEKKFYEKQDYADHWPGLKYFYQDWKSDHARLMVQKQKRNGRYVSVTYLAVSESFLNNKISKSFPTNSFMFAIACCTLKGNPGLWTVFKEKGLGCFFGYDNYVYSDTGVDGCYNLLGLMLYDYMTASEGYDALQYGKVDDSKYRATLGCMPNGSNVCLVKMTLCPNNNHPHAIDMGAAGVWACCNVGASKPEDYGGYYAWGETATKSNYDRSTYKYFSDYSYTKYCTESSYGFTDGKTELDVSDDVARQKWGSSWRMPSKEQLENLRDKCTHEWTKVNNVYGQMFTASNGNRIFLPAAGDRYGTSLYDAGSSGVYWSRTLYADDPMYAYDLHFDFSDVYVGYVGYVGYNWVYVREGGITVRPVRP